MPSGVLRCAPAHFLKRAAKTSPAGIKSAPNEAAAGIRDITRHLAANDVIGHVPSRWRARYCRGWGADGEREPPARGLWRVLYPAAEGRVID